MPARARRQHIDAVLSGMLRCFEHPEWRTLGAYAAQLAHLPLGAFDVWPRVARLPSLAADFLLQPWSGQAREGAMAILRRFDRELPFLWEGVTLDTWRASVARLRGWVVTQVGNQLADPVLVALLHERLTLLPRTLAPVGKFTCV